MHINSQLKQQLSDIGYGLGQSCQTTYQQLHRQPTHVDLLQQLFDIWQLIPVCNDTWHVTNADNTNCHGRYKA